MEKNQLNVLIKVDKSFENKVKYVFNTFGKIWGIKIDFSTTFTSDSIHIYYGRYVEETFPIQIYHDPTTPAFFEEKTLYPLEKINLIRYKNDYLPMLFSKQGDLIRYTSNSIRIRKDIIASAFYFLSCWQEYASEQEISPASHYDFHDSLQHRFGFKDLAVVDRYCELIGNLLMRSFPEISLKNIWPGNKRFALPVSHNIEFWEFWTADFLNEVISKKIFPLKKFHRKAYWRAIIYKYAARLVRSAARNVSNLIRKERAFKFQSTFFITTKSDFPDDRRNYFDQQDYQQQIMSSLKNNSVNLFGSKEAAFKWEDLTEELQKISELSAHGFRVRYFNFDYQKMFSILEKAEIKYDASMAFDSRTGFRAGISFPFQPYNLKEDRPFNLWELPVTLCDVSLQLETGMNYRRAKRHIKSLFVNMSDHKGNFSIAWQTHMLSSFDYPLWSKLFWQMLRIAKKNNAWICSLDKLYNYWQNR